MRKKGAPNTRSALKNPQNNVASLLPSRLLQKTCITVGTGIAPVHALKSELADCTAGREFHPAPKTICNYSAYHTSLCTICQALIVIFLITSMCTKNPLDRIQWIWFSL